MRILHVIESLGRAGAEQALLNLLPDVQKRGHVCEVAALWPPYSLATDLEAAGIKVHRLDGRVERRWNVWRSARQVASLCRRRKFDVVHAHLLFADFTVALSKLTVRRPCRVVTFHNTDFDFLQNTSPTSRLARLTLPICLRYGFDGYAAVSTPVAQHYQQHIPNLPIQFIPNAFPASLQARPDLHRDEVLGQFGVRNEDFALAVVARLAPEKGHAYLFQALQQLRDGTPSLRPKVLLLGQGPLQPQLEGMVAQLHLNDQVVFCGVQAHAQLLPIVQMCEAFVLPSLLEGFPLAPAEAMAMERPVLATRAGGLGDLIEAEVSGLLVPTSDATALADGIRRLMQDAALRKRLGRAAHERIHGLFSSVAVSARSEEFYGGLQLR